MSSTAVQHGWWKTRPRKGRPVARPRGITFLATSCIATLALTPVLPAQPAPIEPAPAASSAKAGSIIRQKGLAFWLASSLERVFPQSPPRAADLDLLAARNGKVSFQVCLRNDGEQPVYYTCSVADAADLAPRVRLVGLTPVRHVALGTPRDELDGGGKFIPGLVPDALWPETTVELCPSESRSFWISLAIPENSQPGTRTLKVQLSPKDAKDRVIELPVALTVGQLVLKPRHDFPVTHWWWGQSTWDYYKTGMFDDQWWRITKLQMQNLFDHGTDMVYVPMFTFSFPVVTKSPGQMLIVREPSPGKYEFDWSRVKRFTDLCREVGFRRFEWSHLWRNWTVAHPPLVYKLDGDDYINLWPVDEPFMSARYLEFLKQLLPELKAFLDEEQLLPQSYFHLADEPQNLDNYRAAREFLRREAPWMRVMDAVQDVRIAQQGLTDIPVALINVAADYRQENVSHWVYYCCVPAGKYLNRFMDTPLPKIRMSGWMFYRLRAKGFLHWGYNYWHKLNDVTAVDPFVDPAAGSAPWIPAGDAFVIYPGPEGQPLDSIRWEVFAESLQDYALLQTAGISPDDALLAPIRSYQDFPRSEQWLNDTRRRILLGGSNSNGSKSADGQ